jgi:hypothetical protein
MPEPVDFLGQQAGPVEDELKTAFLPVIAATPTVQSAYLARVYRSKAPRPSVAVCIRSTIGQDVKVEDRLTAIFKSRFRGDRACFLFLLEEEEDRLH